MAWTTMVKPQFSVIPDFVVVGYQIENHYLLASKEVYGYQVQAEQNHLGYMYNMSLQVKHPTIVAGPSYASAMKELTKLWTPKHPTTNDFASEEPF